LKIKLSEEQAAAVTAAEKDVFVVAGAGSGKTTVLIERVAHLITNMNAAPSEILLLTFTRNTAREMQSRLEKRIGKQAGGVTVGTFHSVALGLMRRFGTMLKYNPNTLSVFSEAETMYLLTLAAKQCGHHDGDKFLKVKRGDIDKVFRRVYIDAADPGCEDDDPQMLVFETFLNMCKASNGLTFDQLCKCFRDLIPKTKSYLQWRHILVDETQDLNRMQWGILTDLDNAKNISTYCVGDIDQSIYGFRGAVPGVLINEIEKWAVYNIDTNWRSIPEIVFAANRLIEHNTNRIPHSMTPARNPMRRSGVLMHYDIDTDAALQIVEEAVAEQDGNYNDVAVLARNHVLLVALANRLMDEEVPFGYVAMDEAVTRTLSFAQFNSILRLTINPLDDYSFTLCHPLLDVSVEEFRDIRAKAYDENRSLFDIWEESPAAPGSPDMLGILFGGEKTVVEMVAAISDLQMLDELTIGDIARVVAISIDTIGDGKEDIGIAEYLRWEMQIETRDFPSASDVSTNDVKLMTIHAAKGLEWPTVILIGFNDGILPSKYAISSGDLEEERRLAYVAITRARDNLHVAARPEFTEKKGRQYHAPISKFVEEAGL